jgi:hypothetical protein
MLNLFVEVQFVNEKNQQMLTINMEEQKNENEEYQKTIMNQQKTIYFETFVAKDILL